VQGVAEAVAGSAPLADGEPDGEAENSKLYSELMEEVEGAKKAGDFDEAKSYFRNEIILCPSGLRGGTRHSSWRERCCRLRGLQRG
jgi:hypothetical protein